METTSRVIEGASNKKNKAIFFVLSVLSLGVILFIIGINPNKKDNVISITKNDTLTSEPVIVSDSLNIDQNTWGIYNIKKYYLEPKIGRNQNLYVKIKQKGAWSESRLWEIGKSFPFPQSDKTTNLKFKGTSGKTEVYVQQKNG